MWNIEKKFLVLDEKVDDKNEVESLLNLGIYASAYWAWILLFQEKRERVEFLCK